MDTDHEDPKDDFEWVSFTDLDTGATHKVSVLDLLFCHDNADGYDLTLEGKSQFKISKADGLRILEAWSRAS